MAEARITGLYIYPVKSCRGISLEEMHFDSRGPLFDRQWMIVDENNQFMTLRNFSRLALVQPFLESSFLRLKAGGREVHVDHSRECKDTAEVTIWGKSLTAGVEEAAVNDFLSDFLSRPVKLVRYQSQSFRDLGDVATAVVTETRFTDTKPVLLASLDSLADLNQKLAGQGAPLSQIERFRPNIVVEGFAPYAEDSFTEVRAGGVSLQNPRLCGRCPVVTQEISTGEVASKATLATLASYRRAPGSNKVAFGVYLTPASLGAVKKGEIIHGLIS